jgi:tetratricopeptide (TPR) repeat protein
MRQGKMARAEEAFCAAVEHFDESGTERAKSHVLISLADLQLKTGRLKEASDTVKQAVELALRLNERIALGDAHELLGRIYEDMGKRRLADKEFASAIRLLHGEGLEQRLAESHVAFAEVLESRGRSTLARKHWKDAANLALQREGAGARQLKAL